jgi:hypothetical protein
MNERLFRSVSAALAALVTLAAAALAFSPRPPG